MDSNSWLFVSHASDDRAIALDIVAELEKRDHKSWIAPRDVKAGQYDDSIADAIDGCCAFLLIFSKKCNDREYISRELTVAGGAKKLIIPIRIEEAEPKRGLRLRLENLHWIDAFPSRKAAIQELEKRLLHSNTNATHRPKDNKAFNPIFYHINANRLYIIAGFTMIIFSLFIWHAGYYYIVSPIKEIISYFQINQKAPKNTSKIYIPAKDPSVYIHIIGAKQNTDVATLRKSLEDQGFFVARIIRHPPETRPDANVIYWNNQDIENKEAATIGRTLEQLNIVNDAKILCKPQENQGAISRQYEVWFIDLNQ